MAFARGALAAVVPNIVKGARDVPARDDHRVGRRPRIGDGTGHDREAEHGHRDQQNAPAAYHITRSTGHHYSPPSKISSTASTAFARWVAPSSICCRMVGKS